MPPRMLPAPSLRVLLPPNNPCHHHHHHHHLRRTFFDLPNPSIPQRFTVTRTLPHSPHQLYALVADIDSYSAYLPYCLGSRVTQRSPDGGAPTEADLRVGWGSFDETFRSKVTCRPDEGTVMADASQNALFRRLTAVWEVGKGKEEGKGKGKGSEVRLKIEFMFTNPVYAALSGTVAPKVAGVMIEAFRKRAEEVLNKK